MTIRLRHFLPTLAVSCLMWLILIVLATRVAHAGELDVLLLGKSWHFDHPSDGANYSPNQYNWGGGLEYRVPSWHGQWLAGGMTYHDSFRQQAYAIYGGYQFTESITPNLNVFAAARVGYLNGSGWHGPGALPSVGIQYRKVALETTYIPKAAKGWNCIAVFARIAIPLN
jgi:hypothetical protein